MKTLRFLLPYLVICFLAACTKDSPFNDLSQSPVNDPINSKSKPAQVKIAVVSDIHYMEPSL